MSEFTIGGFAEDLISRELGRVEEDPSYIAEAVSSERPGENVPDLRRVEIPENFMNQVLGESTQEAVSEQAVVTEYSEDLFSKLHSLVRELDSVLNEMTATGHIGVNMAGKGTKPKVMKVGPDGYIPTTQSTDAAKRLLQKLNKKTGINRFHDDARDPGENYPGIADDPATKAPSRRLKRGTY